LNLTRERGENFIAFLMGGRCAEELVFGEITNGASNDIERATSLARSMICSWGMSDKMGPINYQKEQANQWAMSTPSSYSEKTGQEIDEEIHRLVSKNYETAIGILKDNSEALERLAEGLIVWETLDYKQVKDLVDGKDIGVPIINDPPKGDDQGGNEAKTVEEDSKEGNVTGNPGDDPLPV